MDEWTDRLSEYLDGGLQPGERASLEAHVATCAECARTLEGLRRIVQRAASLEPVEPATDLWPGIEARIRASDAAQAHGRTRWHRRRVSFSMTQLMAATIAALMVSGGAVWLALSQAGAAPVTQQSAAAPAPTSPAWLASVENREYDAAIAELEQLLQSQRSRMDPSTVAVLEQNLAIIDRAVADARAALARDPANQYLNNHLAESMRRKLKLLRQATDIVRAQT